MMSSKPTSGPRRLSGLWRAERRFELLLKTFASPEILGCGP